jgi:hypothetical protein
LPLETCAWVIAMTDHILLTDMENIKMAARVENAALLKMLFFELDINNFHCDSFLVL